MSWPANEPSLPASSTKGLSFGASSALIEGKLTALADGAAQQIIRHLLGDLQRDVLLRFGGGGAEMRRADDVRQGKERARRRRLLAKHVDRGAGDVAGFERVDQSRLVDQLAAGAIDQAYALFGRGERVGIDDVAGLVGQRRVQRDEIGAAQKFVELDLLDAEMKRALGGQERVVGDHFHLQSDRAVGDDRADIAAADDAERLREDLDAEELVLLPFAGAGRHVGLGDLPRQRQHQRDGVLGGGDRVAERRVHDDDAARRRRRNVDIVDADAGAADHLQPVRFFQKLGGDLGRRADGEAVETVDCRGELVLVLAEIGLEIDIDAAILEDLDGGRRQRVGDENSRSHDGIPFRSAQPAQHGGEGGQPLGQRIAEGGDGRHGVTPPSPTRPWLWRRPNRATA